jgi:hypothetical protein
MKFSLSLLWWGTISSLIISSNIVLTQAELLAQPSGAPGAEEPFDFESFFKELTKEIEKVEAESATKAPDSQAPTPAKEVPQPPALFPSPDGALTPTPAVEEAPLLSAPEEQEKRDPVSLFTHPTIKTIETERQKITEPTPESIAAFHTILDDNLTARMEPTHEGLITYLTELENKILGTVSPTAEHFKNDYRTLYQKALNHIILLINQIGSNQAYIKLFLAPPQESSQRIASLRAKMIDCLNATREVLSRITIKGEEEEPIELLKELAQRPSSQHHHHPNHPSGQYQHNIPLSPLEKSIVNVLERLKPIETGLAQFVASKDYQEAIKKLVSVEKAKEKEASMRQERKTSGGFTPWRDYFAPRTAAPSGAPRSMPLPWWDDPSWLAPGSSSSYAPGIFPTTSAGTGIPTSSTGTSLPSKMPPGKIKTAAPEEDKGIHGHVPEEDATQKTFNRALNAIAQAHATVQQTLESIKGLAPDDAARHLLSAGTISKIAHQREQIEKIKLDIPEELPSAPMAETPGLRISAISKAAPSSKVKSSGTGEYQKKIKKAEQELDKHLNALAPYILRANTIEAPEGREQEQKKIPSLYQYLKLSPRIIDERAQELLGDDHKEWDQQVATVRSISPANAANLKKYFDEQKRILEKKAAQFPHMPQPIHKRLEIIEKHLQQLIEFQEKEAAKAAAAAGA